METYRTARTAPQRRPIGWLHQLAHRLATNRTRVEWVTVDGNGYEATVCVACGARVCRWHGDRCGASEPYSPRCYETHFTPAGGYGKVEEG